MSAADTIGVDTVMQDVRAAVIQCVAMLSGPGSDNACHSLWKWVVSGSRLPMKLNPSSDYYECDACGHAWTVPKR
jgi:hypothetical protein